MMRYELMRNFIWQTFIIPICVLMDSVKSLITWFTIICNDRYYDDCFFFIIMQKKLSLMEADFRKQKHHEGWEKVSNKIKMCVNLIDRILKDEYWEQSCKNHDKKWGKSRMVSTTTDNKFLHGLSWIYPNVKNAQDEELQSKELTRCLKHGETQKEQDLDLLFKILRKNIRSWWD